MQKLIAWFNSLPSPLRHASLSLLVLEGAIIVNGFAGAETWPDIKIAISAVPLALAVGLIRWVTQIWTSVPAVALIATAKPCNCHAIVSPELSRMIALSRARRFGPARGTLQVTLNQEQHELLTQPVSAEEAANPVPQVYHGGKLINQGRGRIFNVHFNTPWYDAPAFDAFSRAVVEGGYYRSPDGADTTPAKFLGSKVVAWPFGSLTVTDAQIQMWVDQQVGAALPSQDGYTQVMLIMPQGSTVTAFNEQSCSYFCGYHSRTSKGNYYSVQNDTSCAGCHGSVTPLQALQMVYSHELGEFRADPDGNGWTVDQPGAFQGFENGDLCAWIAKPYGPAELGYTVQPLATNDLGCYVGTYTAPVPVPAPLGTASMVMQMQPRNAVVGVKAPDFLVKLLRADGALSALDNTTVVTLTLPGFSSTQAVPAASGFCTFKGETFANVHSQIMYHFAALGLQGINSAPFDVVAAPVPPPAANKYQATLTALDGSVHQLTEL